MQLLSHSKELLVCGYAITIMFCVISRVLLIAWVFVLVARSLIFTC